MQITLAVALFALATRESVVTGPYGDAPPRGVTLELSTSYVIISPISRLLDALTLLSTPQTIAFFAAIALIVVAALTLSTRPRRRPAWQRISLGLLAVVAITAILEAAAAFAPRPMARLRVANPEVVTVDFHSHTGASHDVRKSFTAEDNRQWHRAGGFDVAYVTDHVRFRGAVAARSRNPAIAGNGVSLLSGVEGRYHRIMSTVMLGLSEADTALLDRRGNLLPGTPFSGLPPVTIVALPNRNLDSVTAESLDSLPRFAGIELVDAAPRGLGQLDRDEDEVRRIAATLRLMLVAGSNNHGYGRTVAAWNLMSIPGWRTPKTARVSRASSSSASTRSSATYCRWHESGPGRRRAGGAAPGSSGLNAST